MLFENQQRKPIKIKATEGVMEMAQFLYKASYPFAGEVNLDDLFEQLIYNEAQRSGVIDLLAKQASPIPPNQPYEEVNPVSQILG